MIKCSICSKPMQEVQKNGVTIDICKEHGIWLDKGELHDLTENNRQNLNWSWWNSLFHKKQESDVDYNRTLGCPHCGKKMQLETYQATQLDWCPDHGVWLDKGELEVILNNLKADEGYTRGMSLRLWERKY